MRTLALHCLFVSGLLLASGCGEDDSKPPEDTGPVALDADGDGHSSDVDCDDADPASYPGAEEVCDGADNDCDGDVDEDGGSAWYADSDGDGYGDAGEVVFACAQPTGAVDDASDCDDGDAEVHPGADELCDGIDNDCDDETDEDDAVDASTWYADSDGDGYGDPNETSMACSQPVGSTADASDCDDDDAAINPEASEQCDGVDNDCDDEIDESDADDASTWYADADGDGFGDVDSTTLACAPPSGYTIDSSDCDDGDAAINPVATELCDGVDNDCDGDTDEADADDASTWYADADGDRYGDAATSTVACDQPSGYLGDDSDCDDSDASVNPAASELCDGVDNDCDGDTDEADAADASTWYADADGDSYGDAATSTAACDQPTGYLDDATDCDDGDASINPAASELCDGADNDCDGDTDEADAADASTWYADVDADGYGDPTNTTVACSASSGFVSDATDCDDLEPSTNPGADEYCDGHDDDCDGDVDEADAVDTTSFYRDADGDGFGDGSSAIGTCSLPAGYAIDSTDCDDSDALVNPDAVELCNSVDDDCDGSVDEPDAADATTWYLDVDGDSYGDSASSRPSCSAPSSYVASGGDCDDGDPSTHPGAEEHCDGHDDDCDGDVDESGAVDASTWYTDGDGDGYGDAASSILACTPPSGTVADDSDCDDGDARVNPGAAERCNGVDDDCDGDDDE